MDPPKTAAEIAVETVAGKQADDDQIVPPGWTYPPENPADDTPRRASDAESIPVEQRPPPAQNPTPRPQFQPETSQRAQDRNKTRREGREEHLRRVAKARTIVDKANANLADKIEQAIGAGVPQTELAKVAGISRVTLWRERRARAVAAAEPNKKRARAAGTAGPVTPSEVPDEAPPP
jgi:hypothetical protein